MTRHSREYNILIVESFMDYFRRLDEMLSVDNPDPDLVERFKQICRELAYTRWFGIYYAEALKSAVKSIKELEEMGLFKEEPGTLEATLDQLFEKPPDENTGQ